MGTAEIIVEFVDDAVVIEVGVEVEHNDFRQAVAQVRDEPSEQGVLVRAGRDGDILVVPTLRCPYIQLQLEVCVV